MQWLGPRVSFSLEDAAGCAAAGGAGTGKASNDFEFLLAGCSPVSTMLPADELFSGGKLVPLRLPSSSGCSAEVAVATRPPLAPAATAQQQQQPETPRPEEETKDAAVEAEQAAEEPKVPARRWRDLLRMRKQQASSSSSSSSSTETKQPLRRLLRRGPKPPEQEPSLSLPLLRDPNEPAPAPASAPTPSPTAAPPVSTSQHQLPPKIRLTAPPPPPPPPPSAVAADSPRLNAAGKVVFNGLGRSSSSPSSLAGGRRHRSGSGGSGMERSYSAHVRVTPVLNVPVCRKSVSVFGIDRLFSPSSASTAAAAHAAAKKQGKVAKKEAAAPPPPPSSSH